MFVAHRGLINNENNIEGFRKVWNKYTASTRGSKIKSTHLFKIFQTLPYPYGMFFLRFF